MVGKSLMQSAALAVLAAVGAMAVPVQAQDADQQEQQEMPAPTRQERFERQAAAPEQRAERQAQRVERQAQRAERSQRAESQAAAPSQDPQTAGGGRGWNRDGNGWQGRGEAREQQEARQQQGRVASDDDRQARILARQQERAAAAQQQGGSAPEGGWRSQRAPDGQRYGRNWDNGGAVNRPAPADDAATPTAPQRGSVEQWRGRGEAHNDGDHANGRNRTYSDPNRAGTYQGDRNRSAEAWRDQQGDRHGTYGNGYHDGRSAHNYRDWHDQNHDRNRYTSGSKDHRRWDRNNWRRDTRYNWSGYRNQHRNLFSAGRYYSPYNNYSYSRLSIGFFLNSGFYGQNYWINDPYQYRLPEIYGPYRWVRYYDDVLLVDIYSGEVVDVIHNFFW